MGIFLLDISRKVIFKSPDDIERALVLIIPERRNRAKPSPKALMTNFKEVFVHHQASGN